MLARTPPHPLLRKSARATRGAFNLLEVLIVVAIIVMLAGVGGFYLFQRYEEAKVGGGKAYCQGVAEQVEILKLNNEPHPQRIDSLPQAQPNGGDPLVP